MGLSPTPRSAHEAPPPELRMVEIDVPLTPDGPPMPVALPANSPEEAFTLLYQIGDGGTGGLTWIAGDPTPRTSATVSSGDLTATAGRPVIFELSPDQREELMLLGAQE